MMSSDIGAKCPACHELLMVQSNFDLRIRLKKFLLDIFQIIRTHVKFDEEGGGFFRKDSKFFSSKFEKNGVDNLYIVSPYTDSVITQMPFSSEMLHDHKMPSIRNFLRKNRIGGLCK